jgi:hypothetical protein
MTCASWTPICFCCNLPVAAHHCAETPEMQHISMYLVAEVHAQAQRLPHTDGGAQPPCLQFAVGRLAPDLPLHGRRQLLRCICVTCTSGTSRSFQASPPLSAGQLQAHGQCRLEASVLQACLSAAA